METSSRIGIESHNGTAVVDPEGSGCCGIGEIDRGVHASAQQQTMKVREHVRVEIVVLHRRGVTIRGYQVAIAIQAAVVAGSEGRRHLRCRREIWQGDEVPAAQQKKMELLIAGSTVPPGNLPVVIDFPQVTGDDGLGLEEQQGLLPVGPNAP